MQSMSGSLNYLSNPKPGHITGGSGRAAHSGAAGHGRPGRMGRRRVSPRRAHPSLVPPRASKTSVLNISSKARTKGTLCKPAEEQNPRLTSGLSAVYVARLANVVVVVGWLSCRG